MRVRDLRIDGGLSPTFSKSALCSLPRIGFRPTFFINFGRNLPIFTHTLQISANRTPFYGKSATNVQKCTVPTSKPEILQKLSIAENRLTAIFDTQSKEECAGKCFISGFFSFRYVHHIRSCFVRDIFYNTVVSLRNLRSNPT